ncbi:MAG: phosphatidylserine decarboxylase [Acidobacteriota bacterium]
MVKDGIPFILVPALIAVGFGVIHWWIPAAVFLFVCLFMAYFFRDPHRQTPMGPNIIVSAADGRVTRIDEMDEGWLVSVFLSPLDVHINRSPISGTIGSIEYTPGKKLPATSNNASFVNERNTLVITNPEMTVKCTQIAGILARRIVCWPRTGDNLERGQRFGLIKFSSRTDLLMPSEVKLEVKVGDRVKGGETIIGRLLTSSSLT